MVGRALTPEDIVDLEDEALAETGNIILNSWVATLANLLKRGLKMSLPVVVRGDGRHIFETAGQQQSNLVLFLHIRFEISKKEIRGYVALLMDIPSLDELRLLIADFIKNAPATTPSREASRDARPLDIVRRGSVTVLLNWAKTPRQNRKSSPCLHWKSRGGFAKLKWRILNVPLFEGGTFEGKKSNNFKC